MSTQYFELGDVTAASAGRLGLSVLLRNEFPSTCDVMCGNTHAEEPRRHPRTLSVGLAEHPFASGSDSKSGPVGARSRKTASLDYSGGKSFTARWGSVLGWHTRERPAEGTSAMETDPHFASRGSRLSAPRSKPSYPKRESPRTVSTISIRKFPAGKDTAAYATLGGLDLPSVCLLLFPIDGAMLRGRSGVLALVREEFPLGFSLRGSRTLVSGSVWARLAVWDLAGTGGWHWGVVGGRCSDRG